MVLRIVANHLGSLGKNISQHSNNLLYYSKISKLEIEDTKQETNCKNPIKLKILKTRLCAGISQTS